MIRLLFLILLLPSPLLAQFGDDDRLYIPPKITVGSQLQRDKAPFIDVEETFYPGWTALVPVLFFDNPGSYEIPERYVQFRSASESFGYVDTVGIDNELPMTAKYYEILNIVGYRMQQHPTARLGIRGAHSTDAGEGTEVALERSAVVQEYLVRIWSIDTARIDLLDPVRRCDTLDNIPLQEEARRVEFSSNDPVILAPVTFPHIGYSSRPTLLKVALQPNMDPAEVDSIIVLMLDDESEIQGSETIAGHPDSMTYAIDAFWSQNKPGETQTMRLVVRIRDRSGRYRASNRVSMPVHITRREEDVYRGGSHGRYTIPFDYPGDMMISAFEEQAIASAIERHQYLASIETDFDEAEQVVLVQGRVDMAENPGQDATEVNISYSLRRDRDEEHSIRSTRGGHFMLMTVIQDADGRVFVSPRRASEAENVDREAAQNEREQKFQEISSRPETKAADSLAQDRARSILYYVIDSLGVPTAIAELRPRAINAVARQRSGFFYKPPVESETGETDPIERSIVPAIQLGRTIDLRPEERFYNRGVSLEFASKSNLEMMAKYFE